MTRSSAPLPLRPARMLPPAFLGVLASLALACSPASGGGPGTDEPGSFDFAALPEGSAQTRQRVRDLITAVTPLGASVSPGERNAWFPRRKKMLELMRQAEREVGVEALRVFGEKGDAIVEVRTALLDVGAHAAPDVARPLLVELFTVYGEDLAVRQKACRLLGLTSPETAIERIEPILRSTMRDVTYPADEQMLYAYADACRITGHDPVELLIHVATDLRQESRVRCLAAEELGKHPDPSGQQALETLIVESAGDNYLRREAAQALARTLPAAELCAYVERVIQNEADVNFQLFLADMLEKHCP